MSSLQELFDRNRRWADQIKSDNPDFFSGLAQQQSPDYLWIGCSDSRVPANQIVGLMPGEVFVHRNVANVVANADFNFLSVLQYAVEVLQVKHVMVVGHYGCGGVKAALDGVENGLIDNWLKNIKDVIHQYRDELAELPTEDERLARLCELNVRTQVANVCHTTIVQGAWRRGQPMEVHGLIYSLKDGLLQDLDCSVSSWQQVPTSYRVASE